MQAKRLSDSHVPSRSRRRNERRDSALLEHMRRHRDAAVCRIENDEPASALAGTEASPNAGARPLLTTTSSRRPRVGETPRPREEATVAHRRLRRPRSRGCGVYAGSTRCPRSGSVPRSASGNASIFPTSSPPTSGSSAASTPPARSAGWGRSPRPAPPTRGGCWSRLPTTTAAARRSVKRQGAASAGKHPRSSTSPGAPSAGSTPAGASSTTPGANPTGCRRRDRARARRLLLGDRHLDTPSRPRSAGIRAGGRPPHTASLQPRKQEEDPTTRRRLTNSR
jgi:hypothetical protein